MLIRTISSYQDAKSKTNPTVNANETFLALSLTVYLNKTPISLFQPKNLKNDHVLNS